jgi:hypothetical protein
VTPPTAPGVWRRWRIRAVIAVACALLARAAALPLTYPTAMAPAKVEVAALARVPAVATVGQTVILDGSKSRRSPLEFWVADGDGPLENQIVTYSEASGFGSVGPLVDFRGEPFGWPTDLVFIDGRVYGIDAWRKWMYVVDPENGRASPWYRPGRYKAMQSLAYQPDRDTFYTIDNDLHVLARARRSDWLVGVRTGWFTTVGPVALGEVTGLAFDQERGELVAYDVPTSSLHWIDPETGVVTKRLPLRVSQRDQALYDELADHDGGLYALYRWQTDSVGYAQIQRVDTTNGQLEDVGPVISNVSAHSLALMSSPEEVRWEIEGGPSKVEVENGHQLSAKATFRAAGRYTVRLTLTSGPRRIASEPVHITIVNPDTPLSPAPGSVH